MAAWFAGAYALNAYQMCPRYGLAMWWILAGIIYVADIITAIGCWIFRCDPSSPTLENIANYFAKQSCCCCGDQGPHPGVSCTSSNKVRRGCQALALGHQQQPPESCCAPGSLSAEGLTHELVSEPTAKPLRDLGPRPAQPLRNPEVAGSSNRPAVVPEHNSFQVVAVDARGPGQRPAEVPELETALVVYFGAVGSLVFIPISILFIYLLDRSTKDCTPGFFMCDASIFFGLFFGAIASTIPAYLFLLMVSCWPECKTTLRQSFTETAADLAKADRTKELCAKNGDYKAVADDTDDFASQSRSSVEIDTATGDASLI